MKRDERVEYCFRPGVGHQFEQEKHKASRIEVVEYLIYKKLKFNAKV
jgi:hypothetical protein